MAKWLTRILVSSATLLFTSFEKGEKRQSFPEHSISHTNKVYEENMAARKIIEQIKLLKCGRRVDSVVLAWVLGCWCRGS
jgi:hypothetical protein